MSLRVTVNPDLLAWALERAGLTVDAVRDRHPDIDDWMNGSRQPLLKELEEFAEVVNAPFGALFLSKTPENWPAPDELHKMNSAVVEIDEDGGVEVPMPLWRALGVSDGDRVRLWVDGDALRVSPVDIERTVNPEAHASKKKD